MLRLRVREVAQAHGINNPVELAAATKISYATAHRMWKNDAGDDKRGVGLQVLYRIAQALNVDMGMLYTDEPEAAGVSGQYEAVSLAA